MNMKRFSFTKTAAAMVVILAGTLMTTGGGGSKSGNASGDNLILEFLAAIILPENLTG
ncbi:hypothetical protein [Succinimonas amylolytica]|uniref:hypothetical protein n=1 Tax=Succinimonas amylolytica TaxID=83769 RepID=UPI0003671D97|nr:hypothetical protein [Succinimonas amylolytica]